MHQFAYQKSKKWQQVRNIKKKIRNQLQCQLISTIQSPIGVLHKWIHSQ
jgi:hypothetical protein